MGCARLYTIATPFAADELFDIDYEQSADVMYMTLQGQPPVKLERYGNTSWTIADVSFGTTTSAPTGVTATPTGSTGDSGYHATNYSYVITAIDLTTNQESLQSTAGSCTNDLTLDGHSNTVNWTVRPNTYYYRIYKLEGSLYGYIGTSTNTTLTDNNIAPSLDETPPGNFQPFTSEDTYPGCVTFYEQRSVFGNTLNRPNAMYMSQSANIENMNISLPPNASDAITLAVAAQKLNAIQHIIPLRALVVLTSDAVFTVQGGAAGYLTPTQPPDIRTEGYRGSSKVRPAVVDDVIFFNTAIGALIRTIGYTFESDGYQGNDLTVFAPHLFQGYSIVDMAWNEYPLQTLWAVRSDGALLALTWLREQQVWGWSLCETDGVVESICSITEGGLDRLYAVINRTVGGQSVRQIERLANPLWTDFTQAGYLDSALYYSGAPQQQFYNLDHLEGLTVCALCNGSVKQGLVVTDGMVDLGSAFSNVIVGLPYDSWIETLPAELSAYLSYGAQSKKQVVGPVQVLVQDTVGIRAMGNSLNTELDDAPADADMFIVKQRTTEAYNEATQPFTGYLEADVEAEWNRGRTVVVKSTPGLPMKILGIYPDLDVGG